MFNQFLEIIDRRINIAKSIRDSYQNYYDDHEWMNYRKWDGIIDELNDLRNEIQKDFQLKLLKED